jgi:tetratricopeptide (TPR) repeat protein
VSKGSSCSFIVFVLMIAIHIPASAQRPRGDFKVEIHGEMSNSGNGYSLHLVDRLNHMEVSREDPDGSGQASFRAVPAGEYSLVLRTASGEFVREEFVSIGGTGQPVIHMNLPKKPERPRPAANRISVRQLQNPPSRSAFQAFVEAQKYSESEKYEQAAGALEKAIRISPDFADAYTNLGAQYIKLGQYEKAIQAANRAMEIGSPNIHDLSNRALAEWALGRQEDAMRSAQQAIHLDRANATTAHYVVGTFLAMNPATRDEGIRHLEIAFEKFPGAGPNLEKARRLKAGM